MNSFENDLKLEMARCTEEHKRVCVTWNSMIRSNLLHIPLSALLCVAAYVYDVTFLKAFCPIIFVANIILIAWCIYARNKFCKAWLDHRNNWSVILENVRKLNRGSQ